MHITQGLANAVIWLTISLVSVAADSANPEINSESLMSSGNEAFRSGDYVSALKLYDAARSSGYEGALLSFNAGVTHYKLGNYDQAEKAFEFAALDSEFTTLSYLNLGLNARKRGDPERAIGWLERAQDTAKTASVRNHITRLLAKIGDERGIDDRDKNRISRADVSRRRPEFSWFLSARTAFDSNAFRSPSGPYVDLSDPSAPLVNPQKQSGFYIPLSLRAHYAYPAGATSNVGAMYQYRGNHYLDSDLSNANESVHRFSFGYERFFSRRPSTRRRVGAAIVYQIHRETDFDRDDGLERVAGNEDVSNRFEYESVGFEAELRNRKGKFGYGVDLRFDQRDYNNAPAVSAYDHDFLLLGGYVNYRIAPKSRAEFGYEYYVRNFSERQARNELGDVLLTNPTLNYTYHTFSTALLQRFSDALLTEFSYAYSIRNDDFVDYNDYEQHRVRVAGSYRFSPKLRSILRITWRDQDYPNAFAFNEPTAAGKQYDTVGISFTTKYVLSERWTIWAKIRYENTDSTDLRGAYDRTRTSLGVSWESP